MTRYAFGLIPDRRAASAPGEPIRKQASACA
jgi:hypothetical protein